MKEFYIKNYKIREILDWYERNQLELKPKFQRNEEVWLPKYESYFLDTLIRGLPTNLFFIREKISKNNETIREVVDGQQRLRTIIKFCKNEITISRRDNSDFGDTRFNELPFNVANQFLNYEIAIAILQDATDNEILDIFARLNTYVARLTAQELRNARYHGVFKSLIYRMASETRIFYSDREILSPRQIVRMTDSELISELFIAMDLGLQDKKKNLNLYYKNHDKTYPNADVLSSRYKEIINTIDSIFGNTINRTAFRRRSLFYSLFCVIYDLNYGLPHQDGPHGFIPIQNYEQANEVLEKLHSEIKSDNPSEEFLEFVTACASQTDNFRPRQTRHLMIKTLLLPLIRG